MCHVIFQPHITQSQGVLGKMSVLNYFSKRVLPNPKGSLLHFTSTYAIACTNEEVEKK